MKGTGGLKGLPKLSPVRADDLMAPQPQIVPTEDPMSGMPGAPPEPLRPVDAAPAAPAEDAAPEEEKPDFTGMDCIDAHMNRIKCPPDPGMEGGWWGPALDPAEVYYMSTATDYGR